MSDRPSNTPPKPKQPSSATSALHCVASLVPPTSKTNSSAAGSPPPSRSKFVAQMTELADAIDLQIETFLNL
jgi:hypothetical protein